MISAPLSARGSQQTADRLAGRCTDATLTPRENSLLKMAGLDMSNGLRPQVMPSQKKGVDTVPHIPASGKKGEVEPWSSGSEMIMPTPRTPENANEVQKRHRRRT